MRFFASFIAAMLMALAATGATAEGRQPTVLTYNIYWGGTSTAEPLSTTIEVIKRSGASIVGIQEKMSWDERGEPFYHNNAQTIGQELGWDYVNQTAKVDGTWDDTAIISKHPIKAVSENHFCAVIDVDDVEVNFCNIHFYSAPYQPYQLLKIPYKDAPFIETEAEAIEFANKTRGAGVAALLSDLSELNADALTLVVGDFNEPSHRDWTGAATQAGRHPITVAWPQTSKLEAEGFVDAYRAVHPDEISHPAFTWTPTTEETAKDDHHDRIDFVFVRGTDDEIVDAKIVGEKSERAELAPLGVLISYQRVYERRHCSIAVILREAQHEGL